MQPALERRGVLEKIVNELDPRCDFDRLNHSQSVLNYVITFAKPTLRGLAVGYLLGLLITKVVGAEEAYAALLHPSLDTPARYFILPLFSALLDNMQMTFRYPTREMKK